MISYRQATERDFDFTFKIKANATKNLVENIWGWYNDIQIDYHKKQFNPNKIKIIIYGTQEVGYISTVITGNILIVENILIDPLFQGKNIGSRVLLSTIKAGIEQNKSIELQVLKINTGAKKLYERLNIKTFEETELHYKMKYE